MTDDPLVLKIVERRALAEGIAGFTLARSEEDEPLPEYTAGSHIEVTVDGVGARHYSLTGCAPDRYEIAVGLDDRSRGGSAAIHANWSPGDKIAASAPRNNFAMGHATNALLIAGGIGVTPIFAIRRALIKRGTSTIMRYSARNRARLAFLDELDADPSHPVTYHLDTNVLLNVTEAVTTAAQGADVYICGPSKMLAEAEAAALQRPDITLHVERFSAEPVSDGQAFRIRVSSTGQEFEVPKSKTILDVLRAEGFDPATSCEGGVCGTCRTTVLSGDICHEDYFLSDAEKASGNCMMICVSRAPAGGTLVLDL